jgi:L-lactate dehydrogenase complex protein LldG
MKEGLLRSVRRALEGKLRTPLPPPLGSSQLQDAEARFIERFLGNGGEVVRPRDPEELQVWLAELRREFPRAAQSPSLPDLGFEIASPEEASLGISLALGAVAETGTLLLGSGEGQRLQLLPPAHLVLVPSGRVYPDLSSALAALWPFPSALGLHSGPSRSSDIGRITVVGVHGPGRLLAVLLSWPLEQLG